MVKKKDKGRSRMAYDAKRKKQAESIRPVGIPNRPTNLNDSPKSLEPKRDNQNKNVAAAEVSEGEENYPPFVPDLLTAGDIDSIRNEDLRNKLVLMDDAELNKGVIEFVNTVAKGKSVSEVLEETLFNKDRSSKIIVGATLEGIHRWHTHPLNGSLGKERE